MCKSGFVAALLCLFLFTAGAAYADTAYWYEMTDHVVAGQPMPVTVWTGDRGSPTWVENTWLSGTGGVYVIAYNGQPCDLDMAYHNIQFDYQRHVAVVWLPLVVDILHGGSFELYAFSSPIYGPTLDIPLPRTWGPVQPRAAHVAIGSIDTSARGSYALGQALDGEDVYVRALSIDLTSYCPQSTDFSIYTDGADNRFGSAGSIDLIATHGDVTCIYPISADNHETGGPNPDGRLYISASHYITLPSIDLRLFNQYPGGIRPGVRLNAGGYALITGAITGFDVDHPTDTDLDSLGYILYDPEVGANAYLDGQTYDLLSGGKLMPFASYTEPSSLVRFFDVNPADNNQITGVTVDEEGHTAIVSEDYAETLRVPYPSHDGYAVVSEDGFFDKIVEFTGTGTWTFQFDVTNDTPWAWSDYHFEFWNSDFTERLSDFPMLVWSDDVTFQYSDYSGGVLSLWSEDFPFYHHAGETHSYWLTINLDDVEDGSFGIRQIATTTIPDPDAILLLTTGALALAWRRGRRRAGCPSHQ